MHITLRRLLFWLFFLAFFAVGTLLIVKTQGFVIDWENLALVKTGGIFIKALPSDSRLFLDGEPYKKPASLWNSGILVKDLLPKTYTVRVERDGRYPWEKTLVVSPGLVASASAIRLFEKEPEMTPISSRILEDFWLVKGGIVEKSGGKLHFGGALIRGSGVLEALPDRSELITTDKDLNFFFVSLSDPETATNLRTLFASLAQTRGFLKRNVRVESVALHPFSPSAVVVRYDTGVFLMDVKKLELQKIAENAGKGALFTASNEAYWVTSSSISAYNLLLGVLSDIPLSPLADPRSFRTDRGGSIFFYKSGSGTLYAFGRTNASSTEIAARVLDFSLSDDEKLLFIVQNDGHALFHYLAEGTGDVNVPKGVSRSFPLPKRFSAPSADVVWASGIPFHLFFVKEGTLVGAETDIRAPVAAYPLAEGVVKAAYRDRKFVILTDDGTLTELSLEF